MSYKMYISETLRLYFSENKVLAKSFYEFANAKPEIKDTRTGDEIAMEIIEKMGLKPMKGGAST